MKQLEQIAAKREVLLKKEYPEITKEVTAVREASIQNLSQLIKQGNETLAGKGDVVYHAKDKKHAQKIIADLCKGHTKIVRDYNNTLIEIDFDQFLASQGIEVVMTNLAEIINHQAGRKGNKHPFICDLEGFTQNDIIGYLQSYVGTKESNPRALAKLAHGKIREEIIATEYGVTGFTALSSENGTAILAENEGNGRLVSNLPYRHIAIVGVEKFNYGVEESLRTIQAATIYGCGKANPSAYSLLSGPSRTADIEFRMAYGMHGPLELHLILLDNGRTNLAEKGCGSLLKCLDCGSCYNAMLKLAEANNWTEEVLTPKAIGLRAVRGEVKQIKGLDKIDEFACPVGIAGKDLRNLRNKKVIAE